MELLPVITGLAVIDSVNPSALVATIVLLLGGRDGTRLVAVYLGGVAMAYFAIGLALVLGLGAIPGTLIESDGAFLVQGVLGAAMLAYALRGSPDRPGRPAGDPPRLGSVSRPLTALGAGLVVTLLELPTALPYLGATGAIARADLDVGEWLPLLTLYNVIFVLPPIALVVGHLALRGRAARALGQLRDRLQRVGREGLLWIIGVLGFVLLGDAVGHFWP